MFMFNLKPMDTRETCNLISLVACVTAEICNGQPQIVIDKAFAHLRDHDFLYGHVPDTVLLHFESCLNAVYDSRSLQE